MSLGTSTLWIASGLAVVSGTFVAMQPVFNGQLGRILGSPLKAAFISFSAGVLTLAIALVLTRSSVPDVKTLAKVPPHLWVAGGMLGAFFVTAAAWSTPRIGIGAYLSIMLCAQLIAAMLLDHFGLLGLDVRPIGWSRAIGASLLITGAVLVTRG